MKTSLLPEAMRNLLQCAESALGVEGMRPAISGNEIFPTTAVATVLPQDAKEANVTTNSSSSDSMSTTNEEELNKY